MIRWLYKVHFAFLVIALSSSLLLVHSQTSFATDYFLTIGGGYNPSGNQASLEANVVFFQQILVEKHGGTRHHEIYFADGDDATADLQVLAPSTQLPATELLASLHRREESEALEYRNHRVPNVAGATDPSLVHSSLQAIAKGSQPGDRLIVYVTAHGGPARKGEPHNTTIACWNDKKITAREFSRWLAELPSTMPIVMVMAQCYCGGFGHTVFNELELGKGLAPQVRAGFFAQQHDLPAAGCRPDIGNDDEFSSYFWGAIVGRSRIGTPIEGWDIDQNGAVSFAEAFAHAVSASPTIDIPLCTSEVLLRACSRKGVVAATPASAPTENSVDADPSKSASEKKPEPDEKPAADVSTGNQTEPANLASMTGTLQSFVDRARPVSGRIVLELSKGLAFALHEDVATVVSAYEEHRKNSRPQGRGGRQRNGSGRRSLLQEISEKWPELGDEEHWKDSSLLKAENQEQLLTELKQLPSWKTYEERKQQRTDAAAKAIQHELREVKFRRMINTLETIVLEQNLPLVATPEIVERYRQTIQLENSSLTPATPK